MEGVKTAAAETHIKNALEFAEKADYVAAAAEYGKTGQMYKDALLAVYCAQSSALENAEQFDKAVVAAAMALRVDPRYAKAWYCKGSALMKAGERDKAKKAFETAASFESIRALKMTYLDWASRCVEDVPETVDITGNTANVTSSTNGEQTPATEYLREAPEQPKPVDNTRMEWYQSASHVNVDVYAKNVIKEESTIIFERSELKVRLARPGLDAYVLHKRLHEDVDSAGCTWSASRFKVEIRLKKVASGSVWKALDKEGENLSAAKQAGADSLKRKEEQEARQQGLKDLTDKELKDYNEDDSSMSLFRTIYKDADEDTQRAMMKSYTESGGQVLSTNWDEVKKKKVTYEERDS